MSSTGVCHCPGKLPRKRARDRLLEFAQRFAQTRIRVVRDMVQPPCAGIPLKIRTWIGLRKRYFSVWSDTATEIVVGVGKGPAGFQPVAQRMVQLREE